MTDTPPTTYQNPLHDLSASEILERIRKLGNQAEKLRTESQQLAEELARRCANEIR